MIEAEREGLILTTEPGGFALLAFDLPGEKVNKLTTPVMETLARVLDELRERGRSREVRGLLVSSHKPGVFIAGADIQEIEGITDPAEGAAKSRAGQKVFDLLESLPFPSVCAVGGACVGGGYELALACTRIVASDDPKTQVGLPEVRLGIIPGFGGTQRLPRRAGLRSALDVILAGRTLDPRRALRAGLVDLVVPASILETEAARELIRLVASASEWRRPRSRRMSLSRRLIDWALEANPAGRAIVAARARKSLAAQAPAEQYPAPHWALESVLASYRLPRERAYENEARLLGEAIVTETSKNLVFLFNAHNAAKKDIHVAQPEAAEQAVVDAGHLATAAVQHATGAGHPGGEGSPTLTASHPPATCPAPDAGPALAGRVIRRVGILGAGTMGAGIAQVVADNDLPVRLRDVSWEAVSRGLGAIASSFRSRMERGRMSRQDFQRKMARISPAVDWTGFATCDLVIEAVLEKMDVKRQVLDEAEAVLREDAIFATNTSSLLVSEIAEGARRPERVVGLHFFNPAPRMPLVEVVAGRKTGPEVLAASASFVARLGKVPVIVRDGPGFLVNRLLMPYLGEAVYLAERGADMEAIDRRCVAWGLPMGPFRLLDEVGLDIARHAAGELARAFPERAPASTGSLDRMLATGRLGSKSGLGFYVHQRASLGGRDAEGRGGRRSGRGGKGVKPVFDRTVSAIVRKEGGDGARGPESSGGVGEDSFGPAARSRAAARSGLPPEQVWMDLLVLPMVNEAAQCLDERVVRSARDVDLAMVMGTGFPPFRGGPLRYADSLAASEVCRRLDSLADRLGEHLRPVPLLRRKAQSGQRFHA